ncbi:hypothetical protein [Haloglycomyces albus]|uniref:hypothetical protein n=1 Tax=Haloglycomyces albus TaxID=526067 RepID=UPI00046D90F1|nr:hypothetical protein [Haloglycomyces albus]
MFEGQWKIARHPAATVDVHFNKPHRRPGFGRVNFVIESRKPDRAGFKRMAPVVPYPNTPVLLVDGEPVSQGIGSIWLELAPGRHLAEVQAGRTSGYWILDVEEDNDYSVREFTRYGTNSIRQDQLLSEYALGNTGGHIRGKLRTIVMIMFGLPMIISLPYLLYMVVVDTVFGSGNPQSDQWLMTGLWYFPIALSLLGLWLFRTYRKSKTSTRDPLPCLEKNGMTLVPYLPQALPEGQTGVAIDLRWAITEQVLYGEAYEFLDLREHGQPFMPDCLYWMREPRVRIGEWEAEAFWGRVWLTLAPGVYEMSVGVPSRTNLDNKKLKPDYVWSSLSIDVGPDRIAYVQAQAAMRHDVFNKRYEVSTTDLDVSVDSVERGAELPMFFGPDLPERSARDIEENRVK